MSWCSKTFDQKCTSGALYVVRSSNVRTLKCTLWEPSLKVLCNRALWEWFCVSSHKAALEKTCQAFRSNQTEYERFLDHMTLWLQEHQEQAVELFSLCDTDSPGTIPLLGNPSLFWSVTPSFPAKWPNMSWKIYQSFNLGLMAAIKVCQRITS